MASAVKSMFFDNQLVLDAMAQSVRGEGLGRATQVIHSMQPRAAVVREKNGDFRLRFVGQNDDLPHAGYRNASDDATSVDFTVSSAVLNRANVTRFRQICQEFSTPNRVVILEKYDIMSLLPLQISILASYGPDAPLQYSSSLRAHDDPFIRALIQQVDLKCLLPLPLYHVLRLGTASTRLQIDDCCRALLSLPPRRRVNIGVLLANECFEVHPVRNMTTLRIMNAVQTDTGIESLLMPDKNYTPHPQIKKRNFEYPRRIHITGVGMKLYQRHDWIQLVLLTAFSDVWLGPRARTGAPSWLLEMWRHMGVVTEP
jgi:hypothetical protein